MDSRYNFAFVMLILALRDQQWWNGGAVHRNMKEHEQSTTARPSIAAVYECAYIHVMQLYE
jgi:hypothetical protein